MRRLIPIVCVSLLLVSASVFGVSRIGKGTMVSGLALSNDAVGFETLAPNGFPSATVFDQDDVRFEGMMAGTAGNPFEPIFLMAFMLVNEQPQWVGHRDREEFRHHFVGLGWEEVPHADSCVLKFRRQTGNQTTWLLSWGNGRGVIFTGVSYLKPVQFGLQQMSENLVLLKGACSWK